MTYKLLFFAVSSVLFLQVAASGASAQTESWGTPYDKYFESNELETEYHQLESGGEKRSVKIPQKTYIEQTRKDGEISTLAIDISGQGAVLCLREIYMAVIITLKNCQDINYPTARKRLDFAIRRIDEFIVVNSLAPLTRDELNADFAFRDSVFHNNLSQSSDQSCLKIKDGDFEDWSRFAERIEKLPSGDFQNEIEERLSIPRLPVTNPCL